MKKLVSTLTAILGISTLAAQDVVVKGPDEKLQLAEIGRASCRERV